jgi:hypothetical protein
MNCTGIEALGVALHNNGSARLRDCYGAELFAKIAFPFMEWVLQENNVISSR